MTTLVPHPDDKSPLEAKAATKLSESGHWYQRNGQQILEVPSANGKKLVKCTLRHARTLDLARGVTSVIRCASAEGLVQWKVTQSVLATLRLPRRTEETEQEWLGRIADDLTEMSQRDEGSRIDAAVESAIEGRPFDPAYAQHVEGAMHQLALLPQVDTWRAQVGVASPWGFGTKIDLVNDFYLGDVKSKDGSQEVLESLDLYDEHYMQVAAGITAAVDHFDTACKPIKRNPNRQGFILFVSRTHPGAASLRMILPEDIKRGWSLFTALLTFCHRKDDHFPFGCNR